MLLLVFSAIGVVVMRTRISIASDCKSQLEYIFIVKAWPFRFLMKPVSSERFSTMGK